MKLLRTRKSTWTNNAMYLNFSKPETFLFEVLGLTDAQIEEKTRLFFKIDTVLREREKEKERKKERER